MKRPLLAAACLLLLSLAVATPPARAAGQPLLLESAQGERFVDAADTSFEGIAAVQHALGKGLSNRMGFGSLKHPETGEPDGAIFLLSVRDRNLSYFAWSSGDSSSSGGSSSDSGFGSSSG